ncbi:MAG: 16S rRNA (cytosine(967)-C(5))-methyltransferase RsmB [Wenzhouxiangellaceae bacterium]
MPATSADSTQGAIARAVAAQALSQVLDHACNLGDALEPLAGRLGSGRDRALARRLCNRVLRDLPALQWRLEKLLNKPLARRDRTVHFLLLMALDQLLEGREPAAAVIHASVAAARSLDRPHLAGLANAVLRNYQRRSKQIEQQLPDDPALRLGMPGWLVERVRRDWPEHWHDILEQSNASPPLWLRVNRRRSSPSALQAELAQAGIECRPEPGLPDALKLAHPARISALPGYELGAFSVQDGGAQAAVELLELADGQRVLDACAAPGGKAAHILERADVALTALELDPTRAARIADNFKRLGLTGEVIVGDAQRPGDWAADRRFDRILIDVPCSATGVMRRHPEIRWLRRPGDIDGNAILQRAMLEALWPLLAPGGLLVYASCSILHAENREPVSHFIAHHADAEIARNAPERSIATEPGRQILPGSLDRDGFYYACIRRL